MANDISIQRSPELLSRHTSGLLVVDVQEKLLPAIPKSDFLVWNIRRVLDAAELFNVRRMGTEQYPAGLGPTSKILLDRLPAPPAKQRFSCYGCGVISDEWIQAGIHTILVVGIEAHVCVLQTVLDLMSAGFRVQVAADAVASRGKLDYKTALRRMESHGATLTTVEAAMFEWCETAADPNFKKLSALVREKPSS